MAPIHRSIGRQMTRWRFALVAALLRSPVSADRALTEGINEAFAFAGEQLEFLAQDVLGYDNSVFTDYTTEDGKWITDGKTRTVWTSGMVAGMFWYMYEATGDEKWQTYGAHFTDGMSGAEMEDDNDVGFQVFNSYGLGFRLTGTAAYKTKVLTGAETLYDIRYQKNIGAFWSWTEPKSRPEWKRAVNVDMLMNLEIMLWASTHGGKDFHYDAAISHANVTMRDIVRPDYSTFHVADYDPDTGTLVDKGTYQGWQDNSTWSRGQAWAIYGYVMIYRFTKMSAYLALYKDLLAYYLAELPTDGIPFSDFDAPEDADNSKDTSASAIVASSLLECYDITSDVWYLEEAQSLLTSLLLYLANTSPGYESVLEAGCARWGDPEVGSVTGDYFFLETMVRYRRAAPVVLLRSSAPQDVNSAPSTRRGLQANLGSFCAVEAVDGVLTFADPDCVPVPPVDGPIPTPSPLSVGQTASPTQLTPTATAAPTASPVDVGATFYPVTLVDSDLTVLDEGQPIIVRLSMDLTSVSFYPTQLSILAPSMTGYILASIPAPAGDWVVGTNTVTFEVAAGGVTGTPSSWTSLGQVVISFSGTGKNTVVVNWLVLGNPLDL